ncbi:hypothetical protein [Ketobacter alkanivorans]|uniref:Multidrug transporter n=1 Tax=Ketobacter alkanivorans TaxID=1917421 RepID=A0A2K9LI35_9GAMM|nr:hypothetical protein [Ketobacter alkanivorans]AUM11165.1 hypothetical protein Kalk_01380 [Ketobacter alkanivorans]MCP5018008.1 hypothetical protein [Ketobacter sp.]
MQYQWITAPFAIFSLILLVIALFMLLRKDWILGWIKGTAGFLFLTLSIIMGLTALNVNAYRPVDKEVTVATISFDKLDNQFYKANVVMSSSGSEMPFEISGDLWQVDARVIKWKGLLATLGGRPGYKLDRIQGRYFTLEDERTKPRSIYALSNPDVGFDLWNALDSLSNHFAWFDAEYGSATFLPMADGALFTIQLTNNGLIARPENDRAIIAIKEWE